MMLLNHTSDYVTPQLKAIPIWSRVLPLAWSGPSLRLQLDPLPPHLFLSAPDSLLDPLLLLTHAEHTPDEAFCTCSSSIQNASSQIDIGFPPSFQPGFRSIVTSSEKPAVATLWKLAPLFHHFLAPYLVFYMGCSHILKCYCFSFFNINPLG